jgi:DNA polymerase I-like protein with 3'-5' exonuclease and polymerase domains
MSNRLNSAALIYNKRRYSRVHMETCADFPSAADLTKKAQILLFNNKELRDLGFRMLIPVHDEIIAECPVKNVKRCAELMSELMIQAGSDMCVPLKCDVALFYKWYGKKYSVNDFN